MVIVVRVLQRVRQHKVRLHAAIDVRQTEQRLFIGAQRVVAEIEKFDAGAEDLRCGLRFAAAGRLHFGLAHLTLAPQLGRFATLAK